jgi:sulfite exporter TauE/SafE
LRPVWTLLHTAAFAFGLALLWTGRIPAWLAALGKAPPRALASAPLRFVGRVPSTVRAAGIGVCWAAMPCGLLQSALVVAALANDAMQGAAVMAAFAAGTSVSLWLVSSAWTRLRGPGLRWTRLTLPVRLAGGVLAASSAFALFHGLGAAIDQGLCL